MSKKTLFELYTVSELAGKDYPDGLLPYREGYLQKIKAGKPASDHFKDTAARILRKTEESLFGPQEPAP